MSPGISRGAHIYETLTRTSKVIKKKNPLLYFIDQRDLPYKKKKKNGKSNIPPMLLAIYSKNRIIVYGLLINYSRIGVQSMRQLTYNHRIRFSKKQSSDSDAMIMKSYYMKLNNKNIKFNSFVGISSMFVFNLKCQFFFFHLYIYIYIYIYFFFF
jgi:hypothetical protein